MLKPVVLGMSPDRFRVQVSSENMWHNCSALTRGSEREREREQEIARERKKRRRETATDMLLFAVVPAGLSQLLHTPAPAPSMEAGLTRDGAASP